MRELGGVAEEEWDDAAERGLFGDAGYDCARLLERGGDGEQEGAGAGDEDSLAVYWLAGFD